MSDQAQGGAALLEHAADLTVAWLSNPSTKISADELPSVIQKIHGALVSAAAGGEQPEAAPEYTPAVSVRRSLGSPEHLISMIDGKPYKMLKRHLGRNGLTPAEYRERYGLKADYPMVAQAYAEKRRDLARKIGLGRRPAAPIAAAPVKPARSAARKTATQAEAPAAAAPAPLADATSEQS